MVSGFIIFKLAVFENQPPNSIFTIRNVQVGFLSHMDLMNQT